MVAGTSFNEEAKPVSQDWGKVAGASGGERCNTSQPRLGYGCWGKSFLTKKPNLSARIGVKLLGQVAVNDVTPLNRDWGMVAGASCS